jgi:hypothetical protein
MTHCMHLSGRETTRVMGAVRRGQRIKIEPGSHQSGGIGHAGSITWLKAGPRTLPPPYGDISMPSPTLGSPATLGSR